MSENRAQAGTTPSSSSVSKTIIGKLARASESSEKRVRTEKQFYQRFMEDSAKSPDQAEQNDPYIGSSASTIHKGTNNHHAHPLPTRRTSKVIAPDKVRNLMDASFFAVKVDLPLNRFVTIHWECAGLAADFQKATGRFLKLAGDWLRLHGSNSAWIWVRESGPDVGEHVHILMHVPSPLARLFSYRQRGWLKACGANFAAGVIKSRPVGRSIRHAHVGAQGGECYMGHLCRALGYVLKGADAQTRQEHGITFAQPGGVILGKRCSTSQNIGRSARKRYDTSDFYLRPALNCTRRACGEWTDLHRVNDITCFECDASRSGVGRGQAMSPRPDTDGLEKPWRN